MRPGNVLKIGIFGLGTVGAGVVKLLASDSRFNFTKALVRDKTRKRPGVPDSIKLVDTPEEILQDGEITCIVEVMGGVELAWTVVKTAIEKDKHVVTANKALISKYALQIEELLKAHPRVQFLFEASVCGGLPIINILQRSLAPDRVESIKGILNGTTNFILSEMSSAGLSYGAALEKAQELGYAEADPRADVEGWDARSKLCILAKLAFGVTADEKEVPCQGITQIEKLDFDYGLLMNRTIKLLAIAETVNSLREEGENTDPLRDDRESTITLSVGPAMVPLDSPLAHVDGALNGVEIESLNLGPSLYVGPGAGKFPTANSVVADLLELQSYPCDKLAPPSRFNDESAARFPRVVTDYRAAFYIRLVVSDEVGIIAKVAEVLTRHDVSIFSVLQTPIETRARVPFTIITEECMMSNVAAFCEELESRRASTCKFIIQKPLFMRYFP